MIKLIPTSSIQKAVKIGMTAAMIPQLKTGVSTWDCNSWDPRPYAEGYAGSLTPTLPEGTHGVSFIFLRKIQIMKNVCKTIRI